MHGKSVFAQLIWLISGEKQVLCVCNVQITFSLFFEKKKPLTRESVLVKHALGIVLWNYFPSSFFAEKFNLFEAAAATTKARK